MTALVGNDGSITIATTHQDALLNRWRATIGRVVSDVTPFGATNWIRNRLGLMTITGTASGPVDDGSGDPINADTATHSVGLTLSIGSSRDWQFDAAITAFTLDVTKVGDTILTYDFVGGDSPGTFIETWS